MVSPGGMQPWSVSHAPSRLRPSCSVRSPGPSRRLPGRLSRLRPETYLSLGLLGTTIWRTISSEQLTRAGAQINPLRRPAYGARRGRRRTHTHTAQLHSRPVPDPGALRSRFRTNRRTAFGSLATVQVTGMACVPTNMARKRSFLWASIPTYDSEPVIPYCLVKINLQQSEFGEAKEVLMVDYPGSRPPSARLDPTKTSPECLNSNPRISRTVGSDPHRLGPTRVAPAPDLRSEPEGPQDP